MIRNHNYWSYQFICVSYYIDMISWPVLSAVRLPVCKWTLKVKKFRKTKINKLCSSDSHWRVRSITHRHSNQSQSEEFGVLKLQARVHICRPQLTFWISTPQLLILWFLSRHIITLWIQNKHVITHENVDKHLNSSLTKIHLLRPFVCLSWFLNFHV